MPDAALKPIHFQRAEFVRSATRLDHFPDGGAEVAFVGRSNAGKSSALNLLTRPGLARVSKTPGRTQLLNVFALTPDHRLVDLPGYGYARAPRDLQDDWGEMATRYLEGREVLRGLILIVDIRRGLGDADRRLMALWRQRLRPLHVVLSKSDQVGRGPAKDRLRQVEQELAGEPGYSAQLFSAHAREGVETLREQIVRWFSEDL